MLYFVRHGQTDWNLEPARCQGWQDVPLNATGMHQAREIAKGLLGAGIETIASSHLRRATQTAAVIGGVLGNAVPLVLDERLAEARRGRWEGRTFAAIMLEEPREWLKYRRHPAAFRFPDGESLVEQEARVLDAVADIADWGRTTLVVSHGGSVRLVLAFLEGCGIECFHGMKVGNGQLIPVPCQELSARIRSRSGMPGDEQPAS